MFLRSPERSAAKRHLRYLGKTHHRARSFAGRGLLSWARLYHEQRRRVVFTTGCFDLLERGHIAFLQRAKGLGDVLIVGVYSDDSVRRLKGRGRPINTVEDRLQVLQALGCFDHTVVMEEGALERLTERVRPAVYVAGGEDAGAGAADAALVARHAGTVTIVPYVEDRSTAGIIERIRRPPSTPAGIVPPA